MLKNPPPIASLPTAPELQEDMMLIDRKLTKEIFEMDAGAEEDSKLAAIKRNPEKTAGPMVINQSSLTALTSQPEDAPNNDMIAKLNKSIEKTNSCSLNYRKCFTWPRDRYRRNRALPRTVLPQLTPY
jgi:hypothetical protein